MWSTGTSGLVTKSYSKLGALCVWASTPWYLIGVILEAWEPVLTPCFHKLTRFISSRSHGVLFVCFTSHFLCNPAQKNEKVIKAWFISNLFLFDCSCSLCSATYCWPMNHSGYFSARQQIKKTKKKQVTLKSKKYGSKES